MILPREAYCAGALLACAMICLGCQGERRDLHPNAAESASASGVVVSELRPGGAPPSIGTALVEAQDNAYAMNEGKRLYDSYNCSGCHAHGGGAIGPALMDDAWIYGSEPANIFATIGVPSRTQAALWANEHLTDDRQVNGAAR